MDYSTRWTCQRGTRPVRVANCSGANRDPGFQMLRQATQGDVDFITGDYLAEFNMASNAEAMAAGEHPGWEPTAWDGLQQSVQAVAEKRIKVVINGGAGNPAGLARKTAALVKEKGLSLKVGYVSGDDVLPAMHEMLATTGQLPPHLDADDSDITLDPKAAQYTDRDAHPLVAANAYLGARAIVKGLEAGADILICGRVADASPVIGAAWYWHSWRDSAWDALAGALVAGHLIECSAYVTGANFSGFTDFPLETFVDIPFGIAEIEADGASVITKHDGTNGLVSVDTVLTQFLYELQGDVYLNSDVKAFIRDVALSPDGANRVRVTGIRGAPPPPTTKLAVFYKGGFESQLLMNATGYGTARKYALAEAQLRAGLAAMGVPASAFDTLEFQPIGVPAPAAATQRASTTYLRVLSQASTPGPLLALLKAFADATMQHFSGLHFSLDMRTAVPRPFLAFYPALWPQDRLVEAATLLDSDGAAASTVAAGHPPAYEPLGKRATFDDDDGDDDAVPENAAPPGRTVRLRLGDVALARSGDKGANVNLGVFPRRSLADQPAAWAWLRRFLSRARLRELLGPECRREFAVERVEFPRVRAVHFVVYGWLGRGVSSAATLDCFGKGFADYVRDKLVDVPVEVARGARDDEGREIDVDKLAESTAGPRL